MRFCYPLINMRLRKKEKTHTGTALERFKEAPGIYWSNILKCGWLQRAVLIHSIIYYELNNNIISDKEYDGLCRTLLELAEETEGYERTEYYYVFEGFTGETGFYLYHGLNRHDKKYLRHISEYVLGQYLKEKAK